ncbi:hypothetical protein DENSPDRAFT_833333 [Dentipellis sp. KUC8613]|nr:hypothetical protein DENSPDRAFT_833333 [Dentipellis sp. KUC8613]
MLRHPQVQVARSCARVSRSFTTTTPVLDAAAIPVTPVSRRPAVTSLGGITIENIPAGPSSLPASQGGKKAWSSPSPDQQVKQKLPPLSADRRQRIRARAGGKRQTSLGWQDSLVSTSFASRLLAHGGYTPPSRDQKQESTKQPREGRKASGDVSKSQSQPQRDTRREAASKPQQVIQNRPQRPVERKPVTQRLRTAQSDEPEVVVTPNAANMVALQDTNFDTLFNGSAPVARSAKRAVTSRSPTLAGLRVQATLARTAGDYSRFVSKRAAASNPSHIAVKPMRYARQVLSFRRDVGLGQRKQAIQVIDRLTTKTSVVKA